MNLPARRLNKAAADEVTSMGYCHGGRRIKKQIVHGNGQGQLDWDGGESRSEKTARSEMFGITRKMALPTSTVQRVSIVGESAKTGGEGPV
jgi:hypothetical protein